MRYFLELSYNGAAYKGWQRQPSAPSIQQTIEEALSQLLGEPVAVTGAGRTDTGVHASYYVAHFDTASDNGSDLSDADNAANFLYHANSMLPPDISLGSIRAVADDAHARFDAREREYTYYIIPYKDPFRTGMAWQYTVPLDIDAMNAAAAHLLTHSDFTSFAKLNSNNKTNICRIIKAEWNREEDGELTFTIRADRFLRNMVRAIVGTLVDVGRGKITPDRFRRIIESKNLSLSSGGAPARGLFLTDITYS